ncbi:Na-translocating system protein MpsC family protein [Limnoglobus roseus]|uniref:Na+-translocating membrane potential-generating system MpsC domain-containing protein n=1 Tax=Limnoglobus roseus TaxID=2598579 RepID=A0A5C1AKX7_9BACT|nr:Na-translocating system protein MpsC family protein [Limnoglobus roseus]QEL19881.1 hypothetical protein PX52LOC_06962 [Limnoglobus roseus]
MTTPERTKAQQIATAAAEFEKARTGHSPTSVTVVLSGETLVITLHGAMSPAERALAVTPTGAAEIQAYRRKLFDTAADAFRARIKEITGVEVRETAAEVEPKTGTVVTVFTTGTVVQVYLLADAVPTDTWTSEAPSVGHEGGIS